ncbi:MAG: L-fucose/L-arabinose isomerase family protein [Kordiimonadaceae bacterium]|nr:L-fucose/L-arabinose isomerase family protein [Kordiimonadaceae bacterium]MBT6033665.1 L-fucose/L-arabinose isomerase family protein [Kordiimonadaceae bacterium]
MGIGLNVYWSQFEGLEDRVRDHLKKVHDHINQNDVDVVSAGLVDDIDKAFAAGDLFRSQSVDIIFLFATTYAVSSTVLPAVQRAGVPVIVLNLQPGKVLDFKEFNALPDKVEMTGKWLEWCNACPVPEIANVFKRAKIDFHQITGTLDDDDLCWQDIKQWVEAAQVRHILSYNRCGLLGHYYNGMLDIYTDVTLLQSTFGGHFEILEMEELAEIHSQTSDDLIQKRITDFHSHFDLQDGVSEFELERAAKTSVALDGLVERYKLGSMAYYYEGSPGSVHQDLIGSFILGGSMLIDNHVAIAGEYEVKNALAMKIMDSFGVGGSFTEFVTVDFKNDIVLLGHDGPGHIAIAEGKTKVRPLDVYHGKPSSGLSVEMSVAYGPITLLSVIEDADCGFSLLIAEGHSVEGEILEIGNTNSRYKFPIGAKAFVENWNQNAPAHHCAIGVGHISDKLIKLAKILDIKSIQVC